MKAKIVLSVALLLSLASTTVYANEDIDADLGGFETEEVINEASDEAGDDLAGFGDEVSSETVEEEVAVEESMFSLSGNVAFKTAYGYKDHEVNSIEYSGFNQVQTSVYLQVDGK